MKVVFLITMIVIGILATGVCLYLLAIMPRMLHRPDVKPFYQWLYAHRGLHDNETDAPENSMKAFRKAVEAGYGIELDIQLSRDKVPVVFHDFTLKRACGVEGKVCDYTFEELQQFPLFKSEERIPKFENFLKMVDGKVPLIVEFKIEGTDLGLCPVADELLKQYKGMYCMESFNPLGVKWYKDNRPTVVRGQLSQDYSKVNGYEGALYFALKHLLFNFLAKPDFVAYNHKHHYVPARRLCRGLFRNTAVAWTIKSDAELMEARKHFDLYIFDSFIPKQ